MSIFWTMRWSVAGLALAGLTFIPVRSHLAARVKDPKLQVTEVELVDPTIAEDEATGDPIAIPEVPPVREEPCVPGRIDDFEQDLAGALPQCEGRRGVWYTFNDQAQGTVQDPAPGKQMPYVALGPMTAGRAIRTHGSFVSGTPGPTLWGGGLGVDLNNGSGTALGKSGYNALARGFKGIRFRAKVGGKPGALRDATVRFPDVNTDPAARRCNTCFNDYKTTIYLTRKWTEYVILWSQLGQDTPSEGTADAVQPFAADAIMAIQWRFHPGDVFDLYLDDIEFVR